VNVNVNRTVDVDMARRVAIDLGVYLLGNVDVKGRLFTFTFTSRSMCINHGAGIRGAE